MNDSLELQPPDALLAIAETLEGRGFQAWAVGGAVRDQLLGMDRSDWDLATDARPDDVRRIFRRTVPIGIEHGTVGVLGDDEAMYEVTTFRLDIETDGRHAVVEFADRIEDDLARRDFTINALAWRPATDELIDPFGGREDLAGRTLRAVGEPADRFAEDYLRILRGLRFAGRFELEIDPPTRAAMESAAGHLDGLSAERVREELMKVLTGSRPSTSLALYADTGSLAHWYPELMAWAADPRRELDLAAVDAIQPHRPLLRLARLLIPGSGDREERMAAASALLERLRFSNADSSRVLTLLDHFSPFVTPLDSSAQLRIWLSEVGVRPAFDLFRLRFADARMGAAEENERYLIATWRRVHDELHQSPPLDLHDLALSGDDLMELGVPEGPGIGILLDELHTLVLEDPELNERETLLGRARELIRIGHLSRPEGEWTAGPDEGAPGRA